jgi:hypothetical protein
MIDFVLDASGAFSTLFHQKGIFNFRDACDFVAKLPYGRNSNRTNFSLVISEQKGTCSSKHALLAALAEENAHSEVELIAGIFLMSPETHPQLTNFFADKPYASLPECHCYLRYIGERFDFTDIGNGMERIASKIVREQRIEPNQVRDWKVVIHKDYLQRWLNRQPELNLSLEEVWNQRETAIALLS